MINALARPNQTLQSGLPKLNAFDLCIHWVHSTPMKKDVGMRVRLDRALRDEFLEACRFNDKPAAQVIREFMRTYVADRDLAGSRNNTKRPAREGHTR